MGNCSFKQDGVEFSEQGASKFLKRTNFFIVTMNASLFSDLKQKQLQLPLCYWPRWFWKGIV